MRKIIYAFLTAAILVSCQNIFAQQVYEIGDYGGPGTIYLYNRVNGLLPMQEVTKTGADISWDLGAYSALNTHPVRIISPDQAIDQVTFLTICSVSGISFLDCFTIWSQTEQALLSKDSLSLFGLSLIDLQRFQNKTNNLLLENFFGFNVDFEGQPTQAVIVYQSPDTIFQFPMMYGDSWTSDIDWQIDLTPTGQNIRYSSNQTRTTEIDSWGTLMTPYDTFTNVIRLRSEIAHQDTLYTDSLDIPVDIIQLEYMWFDTAYKLPVMTATGIVMDTFEIINVVDYIYESTCATPTWTVDTGSDIFYTDSSGAVTVTFELENSNANTYDWDFGDGTTTMSTGTVTHTYTEPGSYSVAVTGCMTNCLPLNSCTSQIIDFSVLVSVDIISGESLGIKLYPNPSKSFIHVDIPDNLNFQNYQIINTSGQVVMKGILNAKSDIQTLQLTAGMYTIRLTGANAGKVAMTRFLKM